MILFGTFLVWVLGIDFFFQIYRTIGRFLASNIVGIFPPSLFGRKIWDAISPVKLTGMTTIGGSAWFHILHALYRWGRWVSGSQSDPVSKAFYLPVWCPLTYAGWPWIAGSSSIFPGDSFSHCLLPALEPRSYLNGPGLDWIVWFCFCDIEMSQQSPSHPQEPLKKRRV